MRCAGSCAELGIDGAPKTTGRNAASTSTCGSLPRAGLLRRARAAAVALARELERRRPDLITAAWWKEERGTRVFIDFNQNAPHKTVLGAWSVRPRVGGAGLDAVRMGRARTDRARRAHARDRPALGSPRGGDPWEAMIASPQSLEPLLELHRRDMDAGMMDAPWPPVYPKMPNEPARVAPSRARKTEA